MPIRDFALTAIVALLLLTVFKHPVMGAYVWAWLGLMNPHKLTYNFAFSLPFAQATAVVTLLALAGTRKRQPVPMNGIVVTLLALLAWMTVTSFFALNDADPVWDRWVFVMKIQVMLLVTWMLVLDGKQLRTLLWVVVLSVGYYGFKGGIWTVMTGGSGRVWGPPGGMLEDNNQLAVGLVMLMPFLYYLRHTEARVWVRHALLFGMITMAFSILGSQSRGALIGLLAMLFFLGLKGKYPLRTSLLLVGLVAVAIAFMPDSWANRMDTMRTFEADNSAMSRVWTWTTLWNAAVDRPLVGAGFRADSSIVFLRYAPVDEIYAGFKGSIVVAHSIYFQMLGEHGFVGLCLYLLLGVVTWFTAARIARQMRDDPEYGSWMPLLMRMVQVSLIGFATGGAFLSLAYLDLPFYIIGFVVSADAMLRARAKRATSVATRATPQPVAVTHPKQGLSVK